VRSARGRPMSEVIGSEALSCRFMARSPARNALFITFLNGSPRRFTSSRKLDSTSGSSVIVVRMLHRDAVTHAVVMHQDGIR
jgi:hypothetical protein